MKLVITFKEVGGHIVEQVKLQIMFIVCIIHLRYRINLYGLIHGFPVK